jgi:hypothetical protein
MVQPTASMAEGADATVIRRRSARVADWMQSPACGSIVIAAIAGVVLWLVIQPLTRATADSDAAASVLYWERIVHGQHLEAFVSTTPKPLLTFIYGLAWSVTHDWNSLAVMTVVVGAVAVGLAGRLGARLGGAPAAAFVAVGLVAWPDFRLEVAEANSFVWGLALWLLAAVLITAESPRPWLTGFALVFAGLARTETVWLVAAAAAAAAAVAIGARHSGDWSRLRLALPPLLGALALPLACLHDYLLTGKLFYWLSVPGGYTALAYPDLKPASPLAVLHREALHYFPLLGLVILAAIGVAWLVSNRSWVVPLAVVTLVGGVMATLVVLGWRDVFISDRYYEEADAAMLLAAAVGGGLIVTGVADRISRRTHGPIAPSMARTRPRMRQVALGAVAAALAILVAAILVPQAAVEPQLARSAQDDAALRVAEPHLGVALAGARGQTMTVKGVLYPVVDPRGCAVFVPRWPLARIAVDTGAPTTALGDSWLAFRGGHYSLLSPGKWVLHIAADDGRGGVYAPFEHSAPTTLAVNGTQLSVVPVFVDDRLGVWLVRIDAG